MTGAFIFHLTARCWQDNAVERQRQITCRTFVINTRMHTYLHTPSHACLPIYECVSVISMACSKCMRRCHSHLTKLVIVCVCLQISSLVPLVYVHLRAYVRMITVICNLSFVVFDCGSVKPIWALNLTPRGVLAWLLFLNIRNFRCDKSKKE